MVNNGKDDFDFCMKETDQHKGKLGYDTIRFNCLTAYKNDLKKQVPNLNHIYDGYLRNY